MARPKTARDQAVREVIMKRIAVGKSGSLGELNFGVRKICAGIDSPFDGEAISSNLPRYLTQPHNQVLPREGAKFIELIDRSAFSWTVAKGPNTNSSAFKLCHVTR
jgi:hypothetical protein